jgi:MFS family permease
MTMIAVATRPAGFTRVLVLSLVARIPIGALSLLVILAVRDAGHSYALAGVASGACALGMAVSAPVLGRLMDRFGQRVVLLACALATAVTFVAYAALPHRAPGWLFPAVALLCGIAQPPVSACARVIWRRLLDADSFRSLLAFDASLQEIAFMLGPLLLVTLATQIGVRSALAATGLAWAAVTAAFALLPETREAREASAARTLGAGPLADGNGRVMILLAAALGVCLGASELGVVQFADEHGIRDLTGVLFVIWGSGSFVGGLFAARRSADDPVGRIGPLMAMIAAATALLAVPTGPWALAPALALAGIAIAPLFAVGYAVVSDITPTSAITEAFAFQSAGLTVGIALGSAVAGGIASATGPAGAFLFGASVIAAAAGVFRTRAPSMRRLLADAPLYG